MKKLTVLIVLCVFSVVVFGESITYEIYRFTENNVKKLIGKGVKEYTLSDVEVIEKEHKGGVHWAKSLALEGGYRVGASIYRESEITGFGLWAKKSSCGFSWEWFNASGSETFSKLQEGGSVSVEYNEIDGLKEIVKVSFDTDISLRINETRKEIGGVTHRILIKKGSILKFSSDNNTFQPTAALSGSCR